MTKTVQGILEELISTNGSDAVEEAVRALIHNTKLRPRAEAYSKLLSPEAIETTVARLEAGIVDVMADGKAVEEAHANRPALMKRQRELVTEIKLAASKAIMEAESDGKNMVVMGPNGTKIPLTNAEQRDAYRRNYSAKLRQEQAEAEGAIAQIDALIARAKESREKTVQVVESLRAIASVQASLLQYLK